jgi:pimeloyl-ACP methyl ester carboxylesterase
VTATAAESRYAQVDGLSIYYEVHGDGPPLVQFLAMEDSYRALAPDPDHFEAFAAKASDWVGALPGWTEAEMRQVTAPTLVIIGDRDFVTVEHASEMRSILPDAQLAVVPGTTHNGLFHEVDIVAPILERFLNN